MRALLLLSALALAAPASADPARELVVEVAPALPGRATLSRHERLAERFAALGLAPRGTLALGLVLLRDDDPANPFTLHPDRVWKLEARDAAAAAAALDSLADDPDVVWAEPNRVREIAALPLAPAFPDDPLFQDGRQWGLRNLGPAAAYGGIAGADIHALAAWQRSVGANDLRLAVADTGIDPDHPDLQAALPGGASRVELGVNVTGVDPAGAFADSFGHGTPVAGVMAARTNDGAHFDSLGAAGVCGGDGAANFGCRIVPIKITPGNTGYATTLDIARAVAYAVSVGARALNLSFAGDGPSRVERSALYYGLTHGCVVVAAAGNKGYSFGDKAQYPAAYAADGLCIQVGASDEYDRRAVFSSHGPGLDLVAPGVDVWTTFMTYPSAAGASYPGYVPAAGTSFAAPFVTGAVGLLAAARPELTDVDFQRVLRESADDIGAPGVDRETGWGRLDAAAALDAVRPELGIWHDEAAGARFQAVDLDTLRVGEGGPGTLERWRGIHRAERVEVTTTVALPDSFLPPVRVWPRVGGTFTVRGGFQLPYFAPWAEVAQVDDGSFTLRGNLYRVIADNCPDCVDDWWVPLPPDQARFGFTVIGRVDRPPAVAVLAPAKGDTVAAGDTIRVQWSATDPDQVTAVEIALVPAAGAAVPLARVPGDQTVAYVGIPCGLAPGPASLTVTAFDQHGARHDQATATAALSVRAGPCAGGPRTRLTCAPNPFRDATTITGPPAARLLIADLAGRVVRWLAPVAGVARWDGADARGRRVPPGLYLVGAEGTRLTTRVARIE
ncbi:MAG: S8 family serine peptidase [Candidatus Eisenbacteria bacterium]|nr:S8 family serine peptidase [Candidatus Eisenbacteria bacterium]